VYCIILNGSSPNCDCDMGDEIFASSVGGVTCDKVQISSVVMAVSLPFINIYYCDPFFLAELSSVYNVTCDRIHISSPSGTSVTRD
jgi:hypothetical protein